MDTHATTPLCANVPFLIVLSSNTHGFSTKVMEGVDCMRLTCEYWHFVPPSVSFKWTISLGFLLIFVKIMLKL